MITAEDLVSAMKAANEEKHPSEQAYIDDEFLNECVVDGHVDFDRVVEILNARLQGASER
jgi:hypothetical protein